MKETFKRLIELNDYFKGEKLAMNFLHLRYGKKANQYALFVIQQKFILPKAEV